MCQKKTKHESEMMKLTSIPCYLIARRVCVCVCVCVGGGGVLNKSVNNLLYNLSDACAFAYAHACTYSRIFCMVLVRYKLTRRKVRLQWYA